MAQVRGPERRGGAAAGAVPALRAAARRARAAARPGAALRPLRPPRPLRPLRRAARALLRRGGAVRGARAGQPRLPARRDRGRGRLSAAPALFVLSCFLVVVTRGSNIISSDCCTLRNDKYGNRPCTDLSRANSSMLK